MKKFRIIFLVAIVLIATSTFAVADGAYDQACDFELGDINKFSEALYNAPSSLNHMCSNRDQYILRQTMKLNHPSAKEISVNGELDLTRHVYNELKKSDSLISCSEIKCFLGKRKDMLCSMYRYLINRSNVEERLMLADFEDKNCFSYDPNDPMYWLNEISDDQEEYDRLCSLVYKRYIDKVNSNEDYRKQIINGAHDYYFIAYKTNYERSYKAVRDYIKVLTLHSVLKEIKSREMRSDAIGTIRFINCGHSVKI